MPFLNKNNVLKIILLVIICLASISCSNRSDRKKGNTTEILKVYLTDDWKTFSKRIVKDKNTTYTDDGAPIIDLGDGTLFVAREREPIQLNSYASMGNDDYERIVRLYSGVYGGAELTGDREQAIGLYNSTNESYELHKIMGYATDYTDFSIFCVSAEKYILIGYHQNVMAVSVFYFFL